MNIAEFHAVSGTKSQAFYWWAGTLRSQTKGDELFRLGIQTLFFSPTSSMLRKVLPRVVSGSRRSLHSSAPVHKVVSTNPVKAEEVQVMCIKLALIFCSNWLSSHGLLESTL